MAKKSIPRKKTKSRPRRGKKLVSLEDIFKHLEPALVRLVNLNTQVVLSGDGFPDKVEIKLHNGVGPTDDGKFVHVDAVLQITGQLTESGDGENATKLAMQVHYQCLYTVVGTTLESLKPYSKEIIKLGVIAMWPYMRELTQSITARMAIPPLILPLFVSGKPGEASTLGPRIEHHKRK